MPGMTIECNEYGNIPEAVIESNFCEKFEMPSTLADLLIHRDMSPFNSETWKSSMRYSSFLNQTEGFINVIGKHVQNDPDLKERVEELKVMVEKDKEHSLKFEADLENKMMNLKREMEEKVGEKKVKDISHSAVNESFQELVKDNPSLLKLMNYANDVENLRGTHSSIIDTISELKANQSSLKEEVKELNAGVREFKSMKNTFSFIKWVIGVGFSGSLVIVFTWFFFYIILPLLQGL